MYPTTTSKNLGFVKPVSVGTVQPENQYQIWVDVSQTPFVHKYFNTQLQQWIPLQSIIIDENNSISVPLGQQVIFVATSGNDTSGISGDLSKPYLTIDAAINKAKTLTPSANNRISIMVYPGIYQGDLTLDTDYIDIVAAVENPQIYANALINQALVANGVNYTFQPRKIFIQGNITISAYNVIINGIDAQTLTIASNGITSRNIYQNIFCQQILPLAVNVGDILQGTFVDVHAVNFLESDAKTEFRGDFYYCGTAGGFGRGAGSVVNNSSFKYCYGGSNSFGGNNGKISNSTFDNIQCGDGCFANCEQITVTKSTVGNSCFALSINSKFLNINGGNGCASDFTNSTFENSIFGADFASTGTGPLLLGNIYNVTADWSQGFAEGRPWRGIMRRMNIQSTDANKPCVNVSSTPVSIAIIEYSKFKHCDGGDTIIGNYAEITFCKFNKSYTVTNIIGLDTVAFNIVNTNLCVYTPGGSVATCPVVTGISAVNNNGALKVQYTLVAGDPSNVVTGAVIQYYDPTIGISSIKYFQVGSVVAGLTGIIIPGVTPGIAYKVSVVTSCLANTSSLPAYINATTVAARSSAWRGRVSDAFCQQGQALYTVENFNPTTGDHVAHRTFDDGGGNTVNYSYTIICGAGPVNSANYSASFPPGVLSVFTPGGMTPTTCLTTISNESWTGRATRNTGFLIYTILEQYYTDVPYSATDPAILTGSTKPNVNTDINYAPPAYNTTSCALPSGSASSASYARLQQVSPPTNVPIIETCAGTPTQTGTSGQAGYQIAFFSDFAGTVPLNANSAGITQIKLFKNIYNQGVFTNAVEVLLAVTITGTTVSLGNLDDHYYYQGCDQVQDPNDPYQTFVYQVITIQGKYIAIA